METSSLSQVNSEQYVIGVGASAGGLEPIHELFDNMPGDTNFAFVILQHLSPDHKSLMGELLSKHTSMRVLEAQDNMPVQPNTIYLTPNKNTISIEQGVLRLHEKPRNQIPNNTIDIFFESLANDRGKYGVGIILSGSGTDGTKGAEAIKRSGGLVIAQDPSTADFDSMPRSAVEAGVVDLVLAPELMAEELVDQLKNYPNLPILERLSKSEEQLLTDVLLYVRNVTQQDFTGYKRPTITRRLAKRMAEKGFKNLESYLTFLKQNKDEPAILAKEFLINVTRFFRDNDAFEELRSKVIPAIFSAKQPQETIKIWCVGCSTGEEAYSLAILLHEFMDSIRNHDFNVKIFATDIDKDALQIASQGYYPETIASDISRDRLMRFFLQEGSQYKVVPALRKMVVFAYHDITKDPPFSKLDLISCRNMLIYMNPTLQKQVLKTFLFALQPGAHLILGGSENIGPLKDTMKEVNRKWKIYTCISKSRLLHDQSFLHPLHNSSVISTRQKNRQKNAFSHVDEIFLESLLEEYKYAGILIDENMEVKHAIGRFKDFLIFPENNFTFNILKLLPPDLSVVLSMGIRKALNDNESSFIRNVKVNDGNTDRFIHAIVKPYLHQHDYQQTFVFIILQEEENLLTKLSLVQMPVTEGESHHIQQLEKELRQTKENLQTLIEELESANEELMTSNEELISANEELQSTNEELQSLNEELHTVSAEHQIKIKELIELNDDLNNYFYNSEIGQVLIDRNLIVRKFTPSITRQINLIETDIGRPIQDITNNLDNINFVAEVKQVILTNKGTRKEVQIGDEIFLMKINPYVRQDRTVDGVVVNFVDITETRMLTGILEGVFNSSPSGITAMKAVRNENREILDFEYSAVNRTAERLTGAATGTLTGKRLIRDLNYDNEALRVYKQVVETGQTYHFEYYRPVDDRWFEAFAVKMNEGLVVTFTDITQKKKHVEIINKNYEELKTATEKLQESNRKLEQSNMDLLQFASVASHDLKEPLRKIQTFGNFLFTKTQHKLEEQEKNYLSKIISASSRMQILIEDVLTLSKLSNTEIPFVETDLNNILKRITDDLEITIKEKKGKIIIGKLPTVEAVPGQMHQLFQNLITNALKFNDNEAPRVHVECRTLSEEEIKTYQVNAKDHVAICVSDNGIGFEDQFREKIFGIFQRLNPTQYNGTGIGLAICKKIIDNHRGFIRAQSTPGQGSTFTIVLPRIQNPKKTVKGDGHIPSGYKIVNTERA